MSTTFGRWSAAAAFAAVITSSAAPSRRSTAFGPDDLNIPRLVDRARSAEVKEVIVALSFTVDGQTTAHYILDRLTDCDVSVTGIAHGVPLGGELHYLDDATLATALIRTPDLV